VFGPAFEEPHATSAKQNSGPSALPTDALPTEALPTEALPTEALPTELRFDGPPAGASLRVAASAVLRQSRIESALLFTSGLLSPYE
jgi:hypothetical protein